MAVMALLGVLSAAASMLLLKNAGIYKILVHLLINPLMFYFCFQQKSIREFLTDYAAGYLIMLLLGGSVEWLCRLLGQRNLFGWVMGGIAGVLSDVLGTEEDIIYRGIESEVEEQLLREAIKKLSGRERTIVELRFGLGTKNGEEMTQKEVADLLGISQSYISRLEKKIMKRLKKEIVKFE